MASQAGAPLLAQQQDEYDDDFDNPQEDEHESIGGGDDGDKNQVGRLGYFVWLLTLSAGISGLLFGCTPSLSLNYTFDLLTIT